MANFSSVLVGIISEPIFIWVKQAPIVRSCITRKRRRQSGNPFRRFQRRHQLELHERQTGLNVDDIENYRRSMLMLYGAEAVRQAEALLDGSERFFGLEPLGTDMQGSAMHQILLAAYDKLFVE